jgi:hypothetical protein
MLTVTKQGGGGGNFSVPFLIINPSSAMRCNVAVLIRSPNTVLNGGIGNTATIPDDNGDVGSGYPKYAGARPIAEFFGLHLYRGGRLDNGQLVLGGPRFYQGLSLPDSVDLSYLLSSATCPVISGIVRLDETNPADIQWFPNLPAYPVGSIAELSLQVMWEADPAMPLVTRQRLFSKCALQTARPLSGISTQ